MANSVSVAEAAKRLTAAGDKIDRSGLSRYLTRHAAALPTSKASGRLTLVDFGALVAHRRSFLGKGPPIKKNAPKASDRTETDALSLADEQQRKLRASRLLALDRLAERQAELVSALEVDEAATSAVVSLQTALHAAAAETAASVVRERGGDTDLAPGVGLTGTPDLRSSAAQGRLHGKIGGREAGDGFSRARPRR